MIKNSISVLLMILISFGCKDEPYPKPHGYPRLDLPATGYVNWKSGCHFNFKKGI